MHYYAYGSNMSSDYIRDYCPSAKFVARAMLANFHIEFRRYSTNLSGGISSIIEAPGERVYGVLYDIAEEELLALDVLENVPEGIYRRDRFLVMREDNQWVAADLYRVSNPDGPYTPAKSYVDYMVAGAKEHGIDAVYTDALVELRATLD